MILSNFINYVIYIHMIPARPSKLHNQWINVNHLQYHKNIKGTCDWLQYVLQMSLSIVGVKPLLRCHKQAFSFGGTFNFPNQRPLALFAPCCIYSKFCCQPIPWLHRVNTIPIKMPYKYIMYPIGVLRIFLTVTSENNSSRRSIFQDKDIGINRSDTVIPCKKKKRIFSLDIKVIIIINPGVIT